MELDRKQRRLVDAWLARASAQGEDEYGRFIAGWIAFNAVCYAFFAPKASRRRPDLSDERGLAELTSLVQVEATLEPRGEERVRLRIEKPGPIQIDIRERYSEDLIYREFAKAYAKAFAGAWVKQPGMRTALDGFLASVKRPNGHYVINMLKAARHDAETPLEKLVGAGIVSAVTAPDDLRQLVGVLYQVRCNVFHGEKVPGEANDDRIVRTARPVLLEIIRCALATELPDSGTTR